MGQDLGDPQGAPQWQGQQQGAWQGQAYPGRQQAYGDTQAAPWGDTAPPQYQGQPQSAGTYLPGNGQQPPPQYQPAQPSRPRKSHRGIWTGAAVVAALIIGVAIGSSGSSGNSTPAAAPTVRVTVTATVAAPAKAKAKSARKTAAKAAASPAPSASASKAPAAGGQTVATFSGSGIKNTAQFTVTDNWKLAYTYDCSGAGGSGNFIVNEDGGNDFSGAQVNELGAGGSSSTMVYGDAGTHYLSVNSECSWTMKVIDES
jgi:hypothetical protein